jgi:D-glycero-D-manno-heptose 1,7-bisphosphate phosphatase
MIKIEQAVIFAGGRGERLRPLTDHLPKPMAPVNGVPFLDYLVKTLDDAGVRKILFLLGYRAETIVNRYGKYLPCGIQVEYSIGTPEDLTGRRLLNAHSYLDDRFLLLYGDNYWPIEIEEMTTLFENNDAPAMTTVFSNKQGTAEYGWENNVEVGKEAFVIEYDKKRASKKLNGVDIGYFMIEKKILDPDTPGNISFEETILASLAKEGKLLAHVTDRQYYYITNMENLKNFEQVVQKEGFIPISLEAMK